MKIVAIGLRGFPGVQGGVEKHCEELYPRLAKLGCQITVLTRSPYLPVNNRFKEWRGIQFKHLWCPLQKFTETAVHTFLGLLLARKLKPDLVHVHAIGPSLFVPLAKIMGLKVVMTHHGPDYKRAKWGQVARIVLKIGERWGVLWSDKIIAISQGIKEEIKNKFNKESAFIPNGVPEAQTIPAGDELKRWAIKPREYIFTACRFVPEKGLHDLVEAYRKIKNPSFRLVITGDADHETDYSRQLKRMSRQTEGIILTGIKTGVELAELFSNAGLFVLPSYYEGLPIALLEALSYGLPVLVSDIPSNREFPLPDFRFFPAGRVDLLSEKMLELLALGISEKEIKTNLAYLRENYNWDKIAQKTFEIYNQIVSS